MKRELLNLLACPKRRGDIDLIEIKDANDNRVLEGLLQCESCSQQYPVSKGIPRLVEAEADVQRTGNRFNFQWVSHWTGKFEGDDYCYGFDKDVYVGWMKERLESHSPLKADDRILDAGCGSGEKTSVFAQMCPDQHVVGVDLGVGALGKAAARFGNMENLDYVQGNILSPPFKSAQFHWGVSIGMLHHTPNTRRAFAEFRRLLIDDASLMI